jgi:hypothetical protein
LAWGHVANDKNATVGAVASKAVSWTSNTTVGNRAFIYVVMDGGATAPSVSSVTDPRSNTWNFDRRQAFDEGASFKCQIEVWSAQIATQILSSDSLTVNFNTTLASGWWGTGEYSGLDTTTTPVDVAASVGTSNATSTAVASGNTANTHAANELVIRMVGDNGNNIDWATGDTLHPAGTERIDTFPSAVNAMWVSDGDSGGSGSAIAASGTLATAENWAVLAVVYKLAGSALAPSHPAHAYGAN